MAKTPTQRASLTKLVAAEIFRQRGEIDEAAYQAVIGVAAQDSRLTNGDGHGLDRLVRADEIAATIRDSPDTPTVSVLGDGLLVPATVAVFYGQPGLGKTWLLLQLAQAVSTGMPWLGLSCAQTPVGFLSLELQRNYIRARLRAIFPAPADLGHLHIVCRPTLRGMVDLLDPVDLAQLTVWIGTAGLGLLIIDPLSRAHRINESSAQEMGAVLAACEQLAAEGPCVVINHHEGHGNPELTSQHPRGSSRILSDPNTVLNLGMHHGHLCLTAKKVNLGLAPEPIYLQQLASGAFEVIERPLSRAEVATDNLDALVDLIENNPGLTAKELINAFGICASTGQFITKATMARYLVKLKAAGRAFPRKEGTSVRDPEQWFTTR